MNSASAALSFVNLVRVMVCAGLAMVQRASHRARPMVFVPTSNPINRPPVGSTARNSSLAVVISGPEMLRSEEHTSELQSLMRISYAVFCLKKKTNQSNHKSHAQTLQTQTTYIESHNSITN